MVTKYSNSYDISITAINSTSYQINFSPASVELLMGDIKVINVTLNDGTLKILTRQITNASLYVSLFLRAETLNSEVAKIAESEMVELFMDNQTNWQTSISIEGIFLGRTSANFSLCYKYKPLIEHSLLNSSNLQLSFERVPNSYNDSFYSCESIKLLAKIIVIRKEGLLDRLFVGGVAIIVILANVAMGCKVELPVVKEVLRRPFAPAVGFFCQFIIMPCVSTFVILYFT